MLSNKKPKSIVTESFIRGRKLNIFLFLSYNHIHTVLSTHYFVMKISKKGELKQIAFSYSSGIDFQDFIYLYKNYTSKPY